jgi:16S rRNA (adenine1518-N6/adenine1519-N6)-dimethyltransferase
MVDSQRELLRRHGIRPVKRRGQNFLIDGNLARWIAARVRGLGARVLELGAGGGALTARLLDAGATVTAVEVDRGLCALLRAEYGARAGFRLREEDLTRLDWAAALDEAGPRPVVAGNLPYVLTSEVLFALADHRDRLAGAVLMVQREVAQRLTAVPGSRDHGVLSAVLGALFAIEIVRHVPPAVFWPRPEVASAVVVLEPAAPWPQDEYRHYRDTVKTLFQQRRKKVGTLLRSLFQLPAARAADVVAAAGVDPEARPEQLSVPELRALARGLAEGEGA